MGISASKSKDLKNNNFLGAVIAWDPKLRWFNFEDEEGPRVRVDHNRDDITRAVNVNNTLNEYEIYRCIDPTTDYFMVINISDGTWLLVEKTHVSIFLYFSTDKNRILTSRVAGIKRNRANMEESAGIESEISVMKLLLELRDQVKIPYTGINSHKFCEIMKEFMVTNAPNVETSSEES